MAFVRDCGTHHCQQLSCAVRHPTEPRWRSRIALHDSRSSDGGSLTFPKLIEPAADRETKIMGLYGPLIVVGSGRGTEQVLLSGGTGQARGAPSMTGLLLGRALPGHMQPVAGRQWL